MIQATTDRAAAEGDHPGGQALSRRQILAGIAAAAVVAGLPIAPPVRVALDILPPPLPVAQPDGWWGYCLDGADYWTGPFDSREQALAEAQSDYPDEACTTGLCIPHQMEAPDLREACVLWLCDGCKDGPLFGDICWRFEGANEDHDFEGEVGDELAAAKWEPLLEDLKDVFAVTLFRHGRPDLIPAVIAGIRRETPLVSDDLDPLLTALETDAQFEAELTVSCENWMLAQNIKDVPARIDVASSQDHAAIELAAEKDAPCPGGAGGGPR